MGSLVAALASYLHARQHGGKWLVRIEDIDPPREQRGADQLILQQLNHHGLFWDGEVLYQSRRLQRYRTAAEQLVAGSAAYFCNCTRRRLQSLDKRLYDRHCLTFPPDQNQPAAIRLNIAGMEAVEFNDLYLGPQRQDVAAQVGDFPIWRRDGLVSYQLAVVIDDAEQGVTDVVRGADLLDNTGRQILLQKSLGLATPQYGHIPVVTDSLGQKLSKQNRAAPLDAGQPSPSLVTALVHLGLNPPAKLSEQPPQTVLDWALPEWVNLHSPSPI